MKHCHIKVRTSYGDLSAEMVISLYPCFVCLDPQFKLDGANNNDVKEACLYLTHEELDTIAGMYWHEALEALAS